jgi:hypothetical protein
MQVSISSACKHTGLFFSGEQLRLGARCPRSTLSLKIPHVGHEYRACQCSSARPTLRKALTED